MNYASLSQPLPEEVLINYILKLLTYMYQAPDQNLTPDVRVNMTFRLLSVLSVSQLEQLALPYRLGRQIIKDLEQLQQDNNHLRQWPDPLQRLNYIRKEIAFIRKLTQNDRQEMDDHISLNCPLDHPATKMADDLVTSVLTDPSKQNTNLDECVLL